MDLYYRGDAIGGMQYVQFCEVFSGFFGVRFLIQKKRLAVAGESLSFHRKRFNVFTIPFYFECVKVVNGCC